MFNILLVDDDLGFIHIHKKILERKNYRVITANSGVEAIEILKRENISLVITDIVMPQMGGLELLRNIKKYWSDLPVIVLTGKSSIESAVQSMREGAYTYLTKPVNVDEFLIEINKCRTYQELKAENIYLKERLIQEKGEFLGKSSVVNGIRDKVMIAAPTNSTILITGESGTGKELIAELFHRKSLRKNKPLIKVNCAALSETILESELFGHEKGAFTGASERRIGRFEIAHEGTLFLDEIGDMSLNMQTKLLRVLQEKEFQRVGSSKTIYSDFRLIAATNKDLIKEVKEGNFREDLYYRINVIPVHITPLRERKEDIGVLFNHFIEKISIEMNRNIKPIDHELERILKTYNWPGNVRELKNIAERGVVFAREDKIDANFIKNQLIFNNDSSFDEKSLKEARENFEKNFIIEALIENQWNISKTAEEIGIARKNLYEKIKKYDLQEN
ncbi:sigma-54-dependent transcriptional regulator [Natronincola ferrireducens]|uniref:Stage 0 sporulation protein A homolog n=1 Tax=Natronincola ferrireducens TaxID=393762 RepID=A0A1G8X7L6_9FIRM|nr:sigma-54 dependent transcriptional regulator [Natronincola ferrireducens]SDJ86441.1 two-component system, NtrC family, nitrogen regulation response regulator NtrX [Natronincola ferrireducens]